MGLCGGGELERMFVFINLYIFRHAACPALPFLHLLKHTARDAEFALTQQPPSSSSQMVLGAELKNK